MNVCMKLALEAVFVGIVTVVFGSLVSHVAGAMVADAVPPICKNWNKYFVMEITLFVTGVLIHLTLETMQVNKWYCTHGNACATS